MKTDAYMFGYLIVQNLNCTESLQLLILYKISSKNMKNYIEIRDIFHKDEPDQLLRFVISTFYFKIVMKKDCNNLWHQNFLYKNYSELLFIIYKHKKIELVINTVGRCNLTG